MSTNHTQHYQLSQWLATDKVERADFNADNAKLDTALHALDGRTATVESVKADKTALSALTSTVNTKADQSALTSAVSRISTLETSKANQSTVSALETRTLRIVTGSYVGDGRTGSRNARSISFASLGISPKLVIVMPADNKGGSCMMLMPGMTASANNLGGNYSSNATNKVTWQGNSVSWYADTYPNAMMNADGITYLYFAVG